jgi:hypothetical protein
MRPNLGKTLKELEEKGYRLIRTEREGDPVVAVLLDLEKRQYQALTLIPCYVKGKLVTIVGSVVNLNTDENGIPLPLEENVDPTMTVVNTSQKD